METITFSITFFFDPYGDGKSNRKVHSREYYHFDLSKEKIEKMVERFNETRGYYDQVAVNFKQYKRKTMDFKNCIISIVVDDKWI